jgi:hypothetical protein
LHEFSELFVSLCEVNIAASAIAVLLDMVFNIQHCTKLLILVCHLDHHCFFIGGCVGQKNHCIFVVFLSFQSIIIAWAFALVLANIMIIAPSFTGYSRITCVSDPPQLRGNR